MKTEDTNQRSEVGGQKSDVTSAQVRDAAIFCLTHGPELYKGWSGEKIFKYLAFQFLTGGIVVEFGDSCNSSLPGSPDIEGVLIAWPDSAEEILRRERTGEFHFNWQRPMPAAEADAFMLADVLVVKAENGKRKAETLSRLVHTATARWPDWRLRRIFTTRGGRLVEMTQAGTRLERFLALHATQHS